MAGQLCTFAEAHHPTSRVILSLTGPYPPLLLAGYLIDLKLAIAKAKANYDRLLGQLQAVWPAGWLAGWQLQLQLQV